MNDSLIIKYLNNQCTPEEAEEVLNWLSKQGDTNAGRSLMKKVWKNFQTDPNQETLDQERFLDRIHHEMNLRSVADSTGRPPAERRLGYWLIRAAAVLFLPLFSLVLLTYLTGNDPFIAFKQTEPRWAEISTLAGGKAKFELPDGTNVWLSFESRLRYPLAFTGDLREVELEGEAYFEVVHNTAKPFRVKAGGLGVLATGTEFNVLAYPDDETIEATLVSGRVEIELLTSSGYQTVDQMDPGDYNIFSKENRQLQQFTGVDTEKYTSWKEGKLIFEDEPLEKVLKRLERWYNVTFIVEEDRELIEFPVKINVIDETLVQVLELLQIAGIPIRYEIIPRKKVDEDTYSDKGQVEIYRQR